MLLKLCSIDPKRQPVKMKISVFLFFHPYFCSGRHGDPYKVSITSYGSLLIKKNICVCKKLEDGALLPVLLWIARFVTKLADGPVISSRAQTKFVWGPDGY